MTLHHISLGTNELARAQAFYEPLMALLGLRLMRANHRSADYGVSGVLFSLEVPLDGQPATVGNGTHVAFQAEGRETVRAFHTLGLAHGGRDAGPPGVRAQYDPHYFSAFLFDPDGHKIEAVTFAAQ